MEEVIKLIEISEKQNDFIKLLITELLKKENHILNLKDEIANLRSK